MGDQQSDSEYEAGTFDLLGEPVGETLEKEEPAKPPDEPDGEDVDEEAAAGGVHYHYMEEPCNSDMALLFDVQEHLLV